MPSDDQFFEQDEQESCCDAPKISQEDGFYVCLNCGSASARILDTSPRRAFSAEEITNRKSNERV